MRLRLAAYLVLTATACLALGALPLRAAPIAPMPKAACCAFMANYDQSNDCSQHVPQSAPEQQCCAACVMQFPLFASATKALVPPPANEQSFAAFYSSALRRVEAPLVPPPRFSPA